MPPRPKDTLLAALAIVSVAITAFPPPKSKKRSVIRRAPDANRAVAINFARHSMRVFFARPGVPTLVLLMHFISGDVARVHLSDSAAALVGKFVQKQGPEIHAALVPSIAANLLENDPDASPPIRNSAGEEVDFAIHALTVLGHNSNTSAVKKGNKVLEQALSAILVLVDTVEPSLPQLVLASTVIDFSLYLPFEAWKLAMDRVGLTLEKHMRAVNFLLVRDSTLLKNLGVVLLEFAMFRFGRKWVDFISKDLNGFLARVFTAWSPDANMERVARILALAHAFDDTFANRAAATPSFALALRPELREMSKSFAYMSAFLCCIGRDDIQQTLVDWSWPGRYGTHILAVLAGHLDDADPNLVTDLATLVNDMSAQTPLEVLLCADTHNAVFYTLALRLGIPATDIDRAIAAEYQTVVDLDDDHDLVALIGIPPADRGLAAVTVRQTTPSVGLARALNRVLAFLNPAVAAADTDDDGHIMELHLDGGHIMEINTGGHIIEIPTAASHIMEIHPAAGHIIELDPAAGHIMEMVAPPAGEPRDPFAILPVPTGEDDLLLWNAAQHRQWHCHQIGGQESYHRARRRDPQRGHGAAQAEPLDPVLFWPDRQPPKNPSPGAQLAAVLDGAPFGSRPDWRGRRGGAGPELAASADQALADQQRHWRQWCQGDRGRLAAHLDHAVAQRQWYRYRWRRRHRRQADTVHGYLVDVWQSDWRY